jgi:hypothetical protein
MNRNGNEKLIGQLFLEMSREDALRAPEFASVLSSRRVPAREHNWSIALAAGLAMLILAVVIGLLATRRTAKPGETSQPDTRAEVSPGPARAPELDSEKSAIEKSAAPKSTAVVRHRRHRPSPDQLAIQLAVAAKSLSEWQSPTASLLNWPGEDLLKSLPRLGDSLETIKSLSTGQFN